jgi:hypothetical protein
MSSRTGYARREAKSKTRRRGGKPFLESGNMMGTFLKLKKV